MRWFFLVVVLVGCGIEEPRIAVQFDNTDMRTVDEVDADGSCGCPAGHTLYCDGQSGMEEPLTRSCELRSASGDSVATFLVRTVGEVETVCDIGFQYTGENFEEHHARAREVMFCNPI